MKHHNQYDLIQRFENEVRATFEELTFVADTHTYYVNSKPVTGSVSGKVKSFVEYVDFDAIAKSIDLRENLTPGTTKQLWEDKKNKACGDGTDAHDFGENFRTNKSLIADTPKKRAILRYWHDLEALHPGRYVLMGQEIRMYHLLYYWPGTCDFILFDRVTRTFIIGDYKTNEDLFKNHRDKTLLSPFEYMLDCPYNHYQIQLSYYQILIEQIPGIQVSDRQLIYLKADGNYKIYNTFDYSKILLDLEIHAN